MHYFPIHLLKAIQTGTDILGNPITTLQEPCAACNGYTGRFTEWTAEDAELVGRDVTQTQRKLLTDAPLARCKEADVVRAGSEDYRITSMGGGGCCIWNDGIKPSQNGDAQRENQNHSKRNRRVSCCTGAKIKIGFRCSL